MLHNLREMTDEALRAAAKVFKDGLKDPSSKRAIDTGVGLYGYNLQAPAKQLVPLMSPFQRSIPRVTKPGSNADNWKVITALSSPRAFTQERAAGQKFTTTKSDKSAAYKVFAIQGEVTREAQAASQGFDDALAKETANSLLVAMKIEGQLFIGSCASARGTPAAPTVADRAGVGTINGGGGTTYFVRVVGLTLPAANRVTLSQPLGYDGTDAKLAGAAIATVQPLAATANSGVTNIGAEGNSGSLAGAGHALKITWTPVTGCVAYAVFIGTVTGAANLKCEAIVAQTSVTITSLAGTGLAGNDASIPATDQSGDADGYDGIIPQLFAGGSGAYLANVNGTLTGAAANGKIVQLQDAFIGIWRQAKIGRFRIVVSGDDQAALTTLGILSNSMQIFANPSPDGRLNMSIGAHVGEVINHVTGDRCPVETEPWMVPGNILILPLDIPYPDANLSAPFTWVGGYDYERWDYASTTTTGPIWPFDIRNWGVLEAQFTGGCGLIYNIFQ